MTKEKQFNIFQKIPKTVKIGTAVIKYVRWLAIYSISILFMIGKDNIY